MTGPSIRLGAELDRLWYSAVGRSVRRAGRHTTDLLMPTWCVGCTAAGAVLCADCALDFRLLTRRPFRAEGGAEALPVTDVDEEGLHVLPVMSAGFYKTLVADVVVSFKDHERVGLSRVHAPALSRSVAAALELLPSGVPVGLVWPPSSVRARLARGRSPVGDLVKSAVLPREVQPETRALRRRSAASASLRFRRGQKGRSKGKRRAASRQFTVPSAARERLAGRDLLLVDDVLTTGATLHGMYAALTEAGARVHGAAVLAVTPRAGYDTVRSSSAGM